jgi:hypothetical protein
MCFPVTLGFVDFRKEQFFTRIVMVIIHIITVYTLQQFGSHESTYGGGTRVRLRPASMLVPSTTTNMLLQILYSSSRNLLTFSIYTSSIRGTVSHPLIHSLIFNATIVRDPVNYKH